MSRGIAALVLLVVAYACVPQDPKFRQYMVEGERLYLQHCANCHQPDGQGLRRVYPPIAGSDYVDKNFNRLLCVMKYGLEGEITVRGVMYNKAMPGVLSLTELELAEIATYISNSWGDRRGLLDARQVGPALDSCLRR